MRPRWDNGPSRDDGLVVRWSGEDPPDEERINVLLAPNVIFARAVLERWVAERSGCAIVVALPPSQREEVVRAIEHLIAAGVAVVYPQQLSHAVRFVAETIANASPDTGDDEFEVTDTSHESLDQRLLEPDFGLGPRPRRDWVDALKKHGTGT